MDSAWAQPRLGDAGEQAILELEPGPFLFSWVVGDAVIEVLEGVAPGTRDAILARDAAAAAPLASTTDSGMSLGSVTVPEA